MEKVKVDGVEVTQDQLKKIKESLSKTKTKVLKEVSPGEYRTLERMNG